MATNKSKSDKIKSCSSISCPKSKHSVQTHSERIHPKKVATPILLGNAILLIKSFYKNMEG